MLPAAVAIAVTASAATPLWLRDIKVSPDGSTVAFTYKGDIFSVPVAGGEARRITATEAYDTQPVWAPDGKRIAFASDRAGSMDIYIVDAAGGKAKRLTSRSSDELPEAFSPDGKFVYFSAAIQDPASSVMFPSGRLTELYTVPAEGGAIKQVLATPALALSFMPDGKSFVYQDVKGMEDQWRKHHTSSVTRDIWLMDAATGRHTNLTAHAGEDLCPAVSADGSTLWFLSERNGGTFNVYRTSMSNPSKVTAVTSFDTHPVRFLSRGANGTLVFGYNGEIYRMTEGGKPEKITINITDDVDEQPVRVSAAGGYTEGSVSPDGEQVALVKRGEVIVTSVEYPTTRRITETPQAESDVTWSPDGKKIAYTSERDGHWNIYQATLGRKEDPNFPNATIINEEALLPGNDGVERNSPQYSPDGKSLAFIQDRDKLMVMDLATKNVRQITNGSTVTSREGRFNYAWSPDSKWIALDVVDRKHDPYYDVAIVNVADGSMTNLTGTAYFDMMPQWVLDGNAVMFVSDRFGMRAHGSWGSQNDIMLVFMNQDALDRFRLSEEDYELLKDVEKQQKAAAKKDDDKKKSKKGKKKAPLDGEEPDNSNIKVELDGIRDRIVRLTPNSSDLSGLAMAKDGSELYYLASFENDYDLWKIDLREGEVSMLKKLGSRGGSLVMDKDGKNLFLIAPGGVKKIDPKSGKVTPVSVSGSFTIDPVAEREYMFDFVKTQERERFYEPGMHGVDWEAMTENYRRFLPHITNNYDFSEMLCELLGELNVSHTGSRYSNGGAPVATGNLGLLYDMTYEGDGLKVEEIVTGGPFNRASSKLAPGHIVETINGKKITPESDHTELFNGIARKKTLVGIYDPASGKRWDEVIIPITNGAMSTLLYERWVKRNEAIVDSLSGGRLGYVHLQSMSDGPFRTVYAEVLGRYNDRDGIVIDTRWNGGGRLHEDIEILFSGKKYLTQVVRGKETCVMPSRRWTKPSIMVQCEANYSNAHGTPWVYKTMGLGKLVGAPVPGTMTSVNWVDLQDDSMYFGIPVVGYRTADGSYLENKQLEPDILILNDPATVVKGVDRQLDAAVKTLLRDIDASK